MKENSVIHDKVNVELSYFGRQESAEGERGKPTTAAFSSPVTALTIASFSLGTRKSSLLSSNVL